MAKLKITPEHLECLAQAIQQVLAENPTIVADYEAGNFPHSAQVKDLQKRFNYDLLYAAVPASWICDNLYPYMDDTHLASALKAICPTVIRKY